MRILFLINIDLDMDGPSVHLLKGIMDCCRNNGIMFDVIQKNYSSTIKWQKNIEHTPSGEIIKVGFGNPKGANYLKRYLWDVKYAKQCKKIYKGKKYDCVFLQSCFTANWHCRYVSKYLKCPIVFNVQDIFPLDIYYDGLMKKWNPAYIYFDLSQKSAYRKCFRIITISDDMKKTLNVLCPKANVDVVYNWEFQTHNVPKEDDKLLVDSMFDSAYFNVLYAGNIGTPQRLDLVVKTANSLRCNPNIRFIIVGNGSEKKKVVQYALDNNLPNVFFYNSVPQEVSSYLYSSCDLNLIPLRKGYIHTSLPSKTAACFNSNRPFIFFADKNDCLSKIMKNNPNSLRCNPDDTEMLKHLILEASISKKSIDFDKKFCDFVQNNSPEKYVSVFLECVESKNDF